MRTCVVRHEKGTVDPVRIHKSRGTTERDRRSRSGDRRNVGMDRNGNTGCFLLHGMHHGKNVDRIG
jgi:hypothetical protein